MSAVFSLLQQRLGIIRSGLGFSRRLLSRLSKVLAAVALLRQAEADDGLRSLKKYFYKLT